MLRVFTQGPSTPSLRSCSTQPRSAVESAATSAPTDRALVNNIVTALQLRLKLVEGGAASEGAGAQLFQQIDKELK